MIRSQIATVADLIREIRDSDKYGRSHAIAAAAFVRSWLEDQNVLSAALVDLHGAMLDEASDAFLPAPFHDAAAVVFGLTRAVQYVEQRSRRQVGDYAVITDNMPEDAIVNTAARAICSAVSDSLSGARAEHLTMARSWLAHAYLHAGIETPGSAQ